MAVGKTAVLALTSAGGNLAKKIAVQMQVDIYLPKRLKNVVVNVNYFDNWQNSVQHVFKNYSRLIFIMATGIVVRTLAPLLKDKYSDPAVVVMDELGSFAVSLLSGHNGGANRLANEVSLTVGAVPVITTATDVQGKTAVDVLAHKLNCKVRPSEQVKYFNRLLAENEEVELYSQWQLPSHLTKGLTVKLYQHFNHAEKKPAIIISREEIDPKQGDGVLLTPRCLVVGIGCRKGITASEVEQAIIQTFNKNKLSVSGIKALASIDIKKHESGLIEWAESRGLPLHFVSSADINNQLGKFQESLQVKRRIGVGGVCEPAALHVSRGRIIVPKQIVGPVTVAVAEQPLTW